MQADERNITRRGISPDAFYRIPGITGSPDENGVRQEPLIPISPATIWRWVRAGRFPKPVKLGPGVTAWRGVDLIAFIESSSGAAK
jgi:predicted DNA-binding transcriptional regulator AlpA